MLVLEPDPQKYGYYIVLAHVVQCRHVARNNQPFSATENLSARNLPSSATLSVALSPRNLPSSATLFPLYRPEIYHLAPLLAFYATRFSSSGTLFSRFIATNGTPLLRHSVTSCKAGPQTPCAPVAKDSIHVIRSPAHLRCQ